MANLEDEFGDIIQKARQGLGMTVAEVAAASRVPVSSLETMEACGMRPSGDQVTALAGVLHLDAGRLLVIAEGGWSPAPSPSGVMQRVIAVKGAVGSYAVMGYLLTDGGGREAVAFDTAGNGEEMLKAVRDHGLTLKYILLTHTHRDHVGGMELLRRATGAPLRVHPAERAAVLAWWDGSRDAVIDDGEEVRIWDERIEARVTPGHTVGGLCYYHKGVCFVGDSIFAGSVGRPQSPDGYRTLLASLQEKVLSRDPGTCLFPGHGPATTVGEERTHNPFFGR